MKVASLHLTESYIHIEVTVVGLQNHLIGDAFNRYRLRFVSFSFDKDNRIFRNSNGESTCHIGIGNGIALVTENRSA